MATFSIKSFGGINPKSPPRYLDDDQAQVAENCPIFTGSLKSLESPSAPVLTLTKTSVPKTIYRFGQDTTQEDRYWFHWDTEVDVCRSQIAGDASEWTFFTDGVKPKATYNALALTLSGGSYVPSGAYPIAWRPLGLTAPTIAPTAVVGTLPPGSPDSITDDRVYAWTWVNKESGFEFESAPSPASTAVTAKHNQPVTVSMSPTSPGGEYIATHKRLYRSVAGTYLLVAEVSAATTSVTDSTLPENLGEPILSINWSEPPDQMVGLINLPNGLMAGFKGRDIYFCDPYHPHAWPADYIQTVDYPVVGLGRMDTTLAVLTKGTPYFIQGVHPDSMAVVKGDIEQACVSKRSIVSSGGAVLYASPDGLVMLSPGGSKIITEFMFTRRQWNDLFKPESIHAYQHDMKYVAFYDTGSKQGGFIFDMTTGKFVTHTIYATCGYSDIQKDELFIAYANRELRKWMFSPSLLSYTWRSKIFSMPKHMGFSCAQLEAEAYPMTVKIYAEGTVVHTQTVTSRMPFRLPAIKGRDWEFQIEGNKEVFAFHLAQLMSELSDV